MRLGDLDALKEIFLQDRCGNIFLPKHFVISTIDNAPTVEINTNDIEYKAYCKGLEDGKKIARLQGKWILLETDCDDGGNNRYECSKCHYSDVHASSAEVPFCWHCGAGMKGGAE